MALRVARSWGPTLLEEEMCSLVWQTRRRWRCPVAQLRSAPARGHASAASSGRRGARSRARAGPGGDAAAPAPSNFIRAMLQHDLERHPAVLRFPPEPNGVTARLCPVGTRVYR
jgi:hypothetical protein